MKKIVKIILILLLSVSVVGIGVKTYQFYNSNNDLETVKYNITSNVSNGVIIGNTTISTSSSTSLTVTASTGYTLPESIVVSGASYEYDNSTGIITLSNPTSDVEITIECLLEKTNIVDNDEDEDDVTTYTVSYIAGETTDFTITSTSTSTFSSLEEGSSKSDSGIDLYKLSVGEYITSPTFNLVNEIKLTILGGTTSTSNPQILKIETLDENDNVVSTTYSSSSMPDKVLGYVLDENGNKYLTITSDTSFCKIRISSTGDSLELNDQICSSKNWCPAIITIEYTI